jgi:ribulose-phosphate 3-epimerase
VRRQKTEISCSLISGNPDTAIEDIRKLENLNIDSWHFDVMDGMFVPRFGLFPEYLRMLKSRSDKTIDVHMMVENPEPHFEIFARNGADVLTPHLETMKHPIRALQEIRKLGCKSGIAVNASTPIASLLPVFDFVDRVTLMAINPGIVGHSILPNIFSRIEELRNLLDSEGITIPIVVDGGVTFENASTLASSGASAIVCGAGTLFKAGNSVEENYAKLSTLILSS